MITEDYCDFETTKLLKEKGFDVDECEVHYDPLDHTQYEITLQMAMKWLREVHNIFFNVNYFHIDVGNKWACLTIWLLYKNGCEYSIEGFDIETIYNTAIKYCLEHLI